MSDNAVAYQKPTVAQVLRALYDHLEDGTVQAELISIHVLESGEVTYKLLPSGGDEFIGGYLWVG